MCPAQIVEAGVFRKKICPSCGVDIDQVAAEIESRMPARKYPSLRVIAGLYQIIALVVALLALIGLLISLQQSASTPVIAVLCLVIGFIGVVSFLALSESIKVFIDVEENTRRIVELLKAREPKRGIDLGRSITV
ncbi:MAG: hypothetical protein JWM21_877 [Acidobacteria bacterium]|nr:hypothetical protein [Acidobacteriota bacterium]